jgi:hypothetical protein
MVVEDYPPHRKAVLAALKQIAKQWADFKIFEFTSDCGKRGLKPAFEVRNVYEWMTRVSKEEGRQATTALFAVVDLSWHAHLAVENAWPGLEKVDVDYLKLLLFPGVRRLQLAPELITDGLELLKIGRRAPWQTIVHSAFGLECLEALAHELGAAYTIQKCPNLRKYYGSDEPAETLRARFNRELRDGLSQLQQQLLDLKLLDWGPRQDEHIGIDLHLDRLPEVHRTDCMRTLRQLYHCLPRSAEASYRELADDWVSLDLDAVVLKDSLAAVIVASVDALETKRSLRSVKVPGSKSGYVFISYVRENRDRVLRLCTDLKRRRIKVWIDLEKIHPGSRWKPIIQRAIEEGLHFLAVFSEQYHAKGETYMQKELDVAIEQLQKHPVENSWFIPVRLDEGEIPNLPIAAGETLKDIQHVDLNDETWDAAVRRIARVVRSEYRSKS